MKRLGLNYKFFLVLLTVYFSCNSFVLAIKYGDSASAIMVAITMTILAIAICKGRNRVSHKSILLIIFGAVNLLLTSVANGYTNAYLLLVLNFLLVIAYIRLFSRQEFYEFFVLVMKILTICAIVVGLINAVAPQLLRATGTFVSATDSYYYDLLFVFQAVENVRINSIWGEPGMFAVFLIFALLLEVFFVEREIKIANYAIFVTGVAFTFSTTGYICMILMLITLLLYKEQPRKKTGMLTATLGLLLIGVFIFQRTPWFQEQFLGMSGKLEQDDLSFVGRVAPVVYNLKEGLRSPLWGHGLKGGKFFVDFLSYTGYLYCNTSTTTLLFSSFGIILSGITIYLSVKFANVDKEKSKLVRTLIFVIVILNVNTQAVHLDQIYWLILFSPFMRTSAKQNSEV